MRLKIGTRKSRLALRQVEEMLSLIRQAGIDVEPEITGIDTAGDADRVTSLMELGGTNFFTGEIEKQLLEGKIDIALHSAKDMPERIPPGLDVAAVTKGIDNRDVFVSRNGVFLKDLPSGARIGLSSKRRKEQLMEIRRDLQIVDIRGNVDERLAKVDAGELDGIVVAAAGMIRLGLETRISEHLDFMTPFLQGRLAVEVRKGEERFRLFLDKIDDRKHWGTVFIVGAGPGDPGLITVKGWKKLMEADVILYDDLVNKRIFGDVCGEAVYVGKQSGGAGWRQDAINETMARFGSEGKTVARLKGGDPFIFGRGGEEIEFLRRNFFRYEAIPGITAAQAAAAYTDIPLTKRKVSSSVAFYSGHDGENTLTPVADTLVCYMAAANANLVMQKALASGIPPETPVAIVKRASLPEQETTVATLGALAASTREYSSPMVMITGKVVEQSGGESWFSRKKKVLVTGTNPERYAHLGEVTHQPLIDILPLENFSGLDAEIARLAEYSSVLFTSKHAVVSFFARVSVLGKDTRTLAGLKVFSIGSETTKMLKQHGLVPDGQPAFESSQGLVDYFNSQKLNNENILLPRSNLAHDELPEALLKMGNRVAPVTAYLNKCPEITDKIDLNSFDIIVFTSPSCVSNFKRIYGNPPDHARIYTVGPVTEKEVENVFRQ